ncbi:protein shisa-5 isoform X2 [Ctenopharyngodon idella]|nr:protein shisa-5 isoform X2 [Ctenopharyngodon idella]
MPRRDDMTSFLQQPASLFDQRVVSKFMKIRPKALGVLEISLGMVMIVLEIWTGFLFLLWSCLISVLTGSVTVSAASKRNKCQILISQFLNCFNAIAAVISVPFHCVDSDGVTLILLVVCDVLVFIISVIVASSSCDCCTKKSRDVAVSYINRDVSYMPDNNIMIQGQQGPFAPPPNYDPSPSAPPAYYNPSPSAPPAYYNPCPSAPPPNYDAVPSAPPLRYDPGLLEPPPSYNQVLLHLQ